jgi:hypothetical protein
VPTTAAQDAARRSLYNMAANDCIVLAQVCKAECRLRSFYVYQTVANIVGPPEVLPHVPSMFGRAIDELRPPPASRARSTSRQARPTSASLYGTHFDNRLATRVMKSPRTAGGKLSAACEIILRW